MALLKRLPKTQTILQVYAVIAVIVSGWTITAFLWKLPAWLLVLNLGEIFTVFAYSIVANLLESLFVLSLLLLLAMGLPAALLREDFVVRGSLLAAGLLGALMAFVRLQMQFGIGSGGKLLIGPLVVLSLTVLLLAFQPRLRSLRSGIIWFADRLTVFLYLLLPLYAALSGYIIVRSLLV